MPHSRRSQCFDLQSRPKECHIANTLPDGQYSLSLVHITLIEVEIFSDAHNYLNMVAGQHACWQEQGRHAWKELSTASSEKAAQDYDLAACNEVHVAKCK